MGIRQRLRNVAFYSGHYRKAANLVYSMKQTGFVWSFLGLACGLVLNSPAVGQLAENEPRLAARYHVESGTNRGYLIVKAEMPAGSYIYGIYQPDESPCSTIEIAQSKQFKVLDKFKADKQAKVIAKDPVFESKLEKYYDVVQFYVPIELVDQVDPAEIKPLIRFTGQMCSDQGYCIPMNGKTMAAKFMGFFQRHAKESSSRLKEKRR